MSELHTQSCKCHGNSSGLSFLLLQWILSNPNGFYLVLINRVDFLNSCSDIHLNASI